MIALMLWAAAAFAGGTVVDLKQADASGRWTSVDETGEAFVSRGGDVRLTVGMRLDDSEPITVQNAMVEIELDDSQFITIYPGSTLALEEWGVAQELGTIFYRVREAFQVQYGSTEALVEGTRFWVAATPPTGTVTVEKGQVRVRNSQGEMVLNRRESAATFSETEAPTPPDRVAKRRARSEHWSLWAARRIVSPQIGLALSSGVGQQTGQTVTSARLGLAATGRLSLPGPLAISLSSGLTNTTETSSFPTDLGLMVAPGRVGIGLQGRMEVGSVADCTTGTLTVASRFGGSAIGTLAIPVSSRLAVEGRAVVGWTQGPWSDVGLAVVLQP